MRTKPYPSCLTNFKVSGGIEQLAVVLLEGFYSCEKNQE